MSVNSTKSCSPKVRARLGRHRRIRKKVKGTPGRPRLGVFRSLKHIYAQVIDDTSGSTLVSASSASKDSKHKDKKKAAKNVGELIAQKALDKGIKKIVFDRGGYLLHGRVEALAQGARDKGLEF